MKNYFVALMIASALVFSVTIVRQKAQAQDTSFQPADKTGATVADDVGVKTDSPPLPGFGAASRESSPIFITKLPRGYAHFNDGKPAGEAVLQSCFPCHQATKSRHFVFTRYSP